MSFCWWASAFRPVFAVDPSRGLCAVLMPPACAENVGCGGIAGHRRRIPRTTVVGWRAVLRHNMTDGEFAPRFRSFDWTMGDPQNQLGAAPHRRWCPNGLVRWDTRSENMQKRLKGKVSHLGFNRLIFCRNASPVGDATPKRPGCRSHPELLRRARLPK